MKVAAFDFDLLHWCGQFPSVMLPIELEGAELNRPKGLPPVDGHFIESGTYEWWKEWKPGES